MIIPIKQIKRIKFQGTGKGDEDSVMTQVELHNGQYIYVDQYMCIQVTKDGLVIEI